MMVPARSSGRTLVSDPLLARPMALRAVETMTASGIASSSVRTAGGSAQHTPADRPHLSIAFLLPCGNRGGAQRWGRTAGSAAPRRPQEDPCHSTCDPCWTRPRRCWSPPNARTACSAPDTYLGDLADAARPKIPTIARLVHGARTAGVQVIHCVFWRRADGRGSNTNGRIFAMANKIAPPMAPGSEAALPAGGDRPLARRPDQRSLPRRRSPPGHRPRRPAAQLRRPDRGHRRGVDQRGPGRVSPSAC